MSDPVSGTLAEALTALQARMPRVAKTVPGQVGNQKYLYADLADVSAALYPIMASLGLSFTARPTLLSIGGEARFALHYSLMHVSGAELSGEYPLPTSGTPQQVGSAITYARRYTLCAVTGLAPGGDDDDAASAEAHARADGLPVNRDGSLSRSRTTDEQKDAAGVMTSAQQAEHSKLRKLDHPRPAERSTGPAPDDPWADQPAGDWQPVTPEDTPGSSNGKQHQQLGILYGQLGITERESRLAEMTDRVGRQITSAKDLSFAEAEAAIRALKELAATEKAGAS
jgi:hypothetical protein